MMGAGGEFLSQATRYGRIAALGGIAFVLQHLFYCFMIVAEKPKLGFALTVLAGITNIVLDLLFIVVLEWGISGAALAPFIGVLFSVVLLNEKITLQYVVAFLVMIAGTIFVVYDTLDRPHST